jgi:hypothetical protein
VSIIVRAVVLRSQGGRRIRSTPRCTSPTPTPASPCWSRGSSFCIFDGAPFSARVKGTARRYLPLQALGAANDQAPLGHVARSEFRAGVGQAFSLTIRLRTAPAARVVLRCHPTLGSADLPHYCLKRLPFNTLQSVPRACRERVEARPRGDERGTRTGQGGTRTGRESGRCSHKSV